MLDRALVYGTQERIVQPVASVTVETIGGPAVQLAISFDRLPHEHGILHPMATSVAIHMDQEVASDLYAQLRETFRQRGWPLPE